jgi:hypothetical protein
MKFSHRDLLQAYTISNFAQSPRNSPALQEFDYFLVLIDHPPFDGRVEIAPLQMSWFACFHCGFAASRVAGSQ